MNKLIYFFLFYLVSCAYPDIDSTPDFKDMKLTKEEAIDLCKIDNSDNENIENCIKQLNSNFE